MPPIGEESTLVLAQRYRLGERVGAGSMGAVWRATDELLGRTVAVKQLLLQPGAPGFDTQGQAYDEARQRILREGRLAARLQHPHAIAVFDVVLHDDAPWLVMEYLPSRTLGAVLASEGPLEPRRVARIGQQIADGLSAAHAAGIVHRDIKPGNVLIGAGGIVKITDFGVSRAADDVQLTRTGLIAGTPAYLAPETARGLNPTPASDVFALGATLYAAVEGEPPFGLDDNAYALLYKVGAGTIRPPERAGPLTDTLLHMLRADPAERPTATEARDELAAVAAGRQPIAPSPPTAPARGSRRTPSIRRSGSSRRARRLAATRVDLDPVSPAEIGPNPRVGPAPVTPSQRPPSRPLWSQLPQPPPTQPLATASGSSDGTPSGGARVDDSRSDSRGNSRGDSRDGDSAADASELTPDAAGPDSAGSDSDGGGPATAAWSAEGPDTAEWSAEGPDTAEWSAEGPATAAWSAERPDTAAWSAEADGWGSDRAGWPDERFGVDPVGPAGGAGAVGAGAGAGRAAAANAEAGRAANAGTGHAGAGAGARGAGFAGAAAGADQRGVTAALYSGGQPATSALPAWRQPDRPRRWFDLSRRGASLWALVALVVLVIAAAATVAELRRDAAPGSSGGSSAAAPSTGPAAPATPVEIRPDGPPTAADLESFVRGYYALLPAQPAAAWQMLGDQARSASDGYQSYLNFYNSLDSVGFAEAPTAVDGKTVRATLRFATKAGAESVERYEFTVVPGSDGKLVMSSFAKG
jgi:serine/threonine protein kinase